WKERKISQSFDLGAGAIPLEVRFAHDPSKAWGYVGAALSSTIWLFAAGKDGKWTAKKAIELPPVKNDKFPGGAVPALISDFVVSMDDKLLYVSSWLHGEIRQYDISDPAEPRLVGAIHVGGITHPPLKVKGKELGGGRRCCNCRSTASGCTSQTPS